MAEDPKCLSSSYQEAYSNTVLTVSQNGVHEGDRGSPVPYVLSIELTSEKVYVSCCKFHFFFQVTPRKVIYMAKYN